MKILALVLISITCFAQQPAVMDPVLVQDLDFTLVRPEFGKVYRVMLRKDHALLAEGIPDSTWVQICYGCQITNTPPPIRIDTIDSELLVYEGWARYGATSTPGWYKGTISYSSAGEASYTFVGTGVEVWGETAPNHGVGNVTVGTTKTGYWGTFDINGDGQLSANEVKTGQTLPAKIVEFKGLPQGQHTVTIKPVSGTILIDFLVIQR